MDTKLYGLIQSGEVMTISKCYCGGFQEKVLDNITWCHKIENMTYIVTPDTFHAV